MLIIIPPWESHPNSRTTALSMYTDRDDHVSYDDGGDDHSFSHLLMIIMIGPPCPNTVLAGKPLT